jgi:hypothetical protein
MTVVIFLLLALERLLRHLNQAILGLAIGEVGKSLDRLVRIILCQRPRLLDAVALQNQLTCLYTHRLASIAEAPQNGR